MSTNGIDTILFGNADGEWLRASEAVQPRRTQDETDAAEMALPTRYADLIKRAEQIENEQAAAVEAARKMVEQGTLDTPENIREAARNLLDYGI